MIQYLLSLVILVVGVSFVAGLALRLSGEASGGKILSACFLIFFLYAVFTVVYQTGSGYEGIPFSDVYSRGIGIKDYYLNDFAGFVYNAAQLLTLTFLMSLIGGFVPEDLGGKYIGIVFSKTVIVMLALIINHYVITGVQGNPVFQTAITGLTWFFGGSTAVFTPALVLLGLIKTITGISDDDNPFVKFLADELPKTKVGKALKTAFGTSMVYLFYLFVMDEYFGGFNNVVLGATQIIEAFAPIVLMIVGIILMVKVIIK